MGFPKNLQLIKFNQIFRFALSHWYNVFTNLEKAQYNYGINYDKTVTIKP